MALFEKLQKLRGDLVKLYKSNGVKADMLETGLDELEEKTDYMFSIDPTFVAYKADAKDPVDLKLGDYLRIHSSVTPLFKKLDKNLYMFGSEKLTGLINNGKLSFKHENGTIVTINELVKNSFKSEVEAVILKANKLIPREYGIFMISKSI